MTRQESDDRIEPQAERKLGETRSVEASGGGEAVAVNEQAKQLALDLGAAEERARARTDGGAARNRMRAVTIAAPKPRDKSGKATPATMEQVVAHVEEAFANVARNKGAPGPDGQGIAYVREHLGELLPEITTALLEGTYLPGQIRRVWIPKAGGGERGLGVPDVIDRMIQEAVRLVLEPLYEPTFHPSSHGFRPGRSCHTAIDQAKGYVDDGNEWVVDMDLEKFFDRVHHQRLMAKLAQRVLDKRLLVLIGRMLKAKVVMPNGVVVRNEEGVPQGGPLSPLLSNIVLDELDWELERRGHRFVRYADDSNVYVRSERAGQRVMASLCRFIEKRLRLKVNAEKSAVARPEERHFLGFRLRREPMDGRVEVLLSQRTKERIDRKIREMTPRTWGQSMGRCTKRLNEYLRGWMGYFGFCTQGVETVLGSLDAHIRRRLRAIQLQHWKRKRTVARKLMAMGIRSKVAWRSVYERRKSRWALSHSPAVDWALRNSFWDARGLLSLQGLWSQHPRRIVAPAQLMLVLG
jgi:group II intron reverse transcriptase/maturase